MSSRISKAPPDSKFEFVRAILWFLFLLGVWICISLLPYWKLSKFDLAYGLTVWFGPPIGLVVILILMLADAISRNWAFPRDIAVFVALTIAVNLTGLVLSRVAEPFGMRPLLVISAIMIARRFVRSLMTWARSA